MKYIYSRKLYSFNNIEFLVNQFPQPLYNNYTRFFL